MKTGTRAPSAVRPLLVALLALVIVGSFWLTSASAQTRVGTPATTVSSATASATQSVISATTSSATTAATASATTTAPAATTRSPATLSVSLAALGVSGAVSVAVYDLDDGDQLTAGAGTFETASIVKVDILVSLLVQRNGSLTASQKALAKSMITLSDNTAATALFKAVGGASGLNTTNKVLGLVETTAGTNGNWGLTRTTSADQLRLLKLVFQSNTILSEASRSYVSALMSSVSESQDWGVTAAADDEDDSAVKNGWLPRSSTGLWDVTSIGRVVASKHHLLVVVLVTSATSETAGIATIEKAASAAVTKVVAA